MRITFRMLIPLVLLAALPLGAADPKPAATPKPTATPKAAPAPKTTPAVKAMPTTPAQAEPKPLTPEEREKTFYALGQALARNISVFGLSESELKQVEDGLSDGILGRPAKVKAEEYMPKLQELARERMTAAAEAEKKSGAAYLEKAAAEPGAVKKPSGLVYKELKAGTGETPKATDRVKVHYTGRLTDGTVFDSSVERGQPAEFPLNGVIPCWTEGVQLMKVGGKARLVCPSSIAYGDNGAPPRIKPGSTLDFEVELLGIEAPAPTPAMPAGHPSVGQPTTPTPVMTPDKKQPPTKEPDKK